MEILDIKVGDIVLVEAPNHQRRLEYLRQDSTGCYLSYCWLPMNQIGNKIAEGILKITIVGNLKDNPDYLKGEAVAYLEKGIETESDRSRIVETQLLPEILTKIERNGKIDTYSTDGKWICPYCGYAYEYDHTEDTPQDIEFDDYEWQCPQCQKKYYVKQRCYFTHETFKI